jgi:hypothetical protein
MRRRIFRHIADNHFCPGITRLKIVNDRMGNFSRYDLLPLGLLWISRMFFMLVLISVFCLFLNDAGFVFLTKGTRNGQHELGSDNQCGSLIKRSDYSLPFRAAIPAIRTNLAGPDYK